MGLRYNIDSITSSSIEGWAYAGAGFGHACIGIYDQRDELIEKFFADQYREDLFIAGIGNGKHSFIYNGNIRHVRYIIISCIETGQTVKIGIDKRLEGLPSFDNVAIHETLAAIESAVSELRPSQLPRLLSQLPLDVFGQLLLDVPEEYPKARSFLPVMPTDEVQVNWTGSSGEFLLLTSCAFIRSLLLVYAKYGCKNIYEAKILDYGCGWGRLSRLLLKYIPSTQLYAADAWQQSLNLFDAGNIHKQYVLTEEYPVDTPFPQVKMDLVFAFSVFTHTSEICSNHILSCLRKQIDDNGLLVLTVRPVNYWDNAQESITEEKVDELKKLHATYGYAFVPHNRPEKCIHGVNDISYGDTSISIDYIKSVWKEWEFVEADFNLVAPMQTIIILRPK